MKEINLTITVASKSQLESTFDILNRLTYVKNIALNSSNNTISFSLSEEKDEATLQNELKEKGLNDFLIRKKGLAKKKIFAYFEKREK